MKVDRDYLQRAKTIWMLNDTTSVGLLSLGGSSFVANASGSLLVLDEFPCENCTRKGALAIALSDFDIGPNHFSNVRLETGGWDDFDLQFLVGGLFVLPADLPINFSGLFNGEQFYEQIRTPQDFLGVILGRNLLLQINLDLGEGENFSLVLNAVNSNFPPTARAATPASTAATSIDGALMHVDGSGSTDADGVIVNFTWLRDGQVVAAGAKAQIQSPIGTTRYQLVVTDNLGSSATQAIDVTVIDPPPTLILPAEIAAPCQRASGADVRFDASRTVDVVPDIVRYEWRSGGSLVAEGVLVDVEVPIGETVYTLVVVEASGRQTSGQFVVRVRPQVFLAALCATTDVKLANGAKVVAGSALDARPPAADLVIAGRDVSLSNGSRIFGNVSVSCNATLSNSAQVTGHVAYGQDLSLSNGAIVGSSSQVLSCGQPQECSCGVPTVGVAPAYAAGGPLGADVHGNVNVWGDRVITLASGTYSAMNLQVVNNAKLQVATGATVTLHVLGDLLVANNARLDGSAGALRVYVHGNGGVVNLVNGAVSKLQVIAPERDIKIVNDADMIGAVIGRHIELINAGNFLYGAGDNEQ